MEFVGLGKGKRFAHKATQSLPQGVVPAFDMRGFACCFSHGVMVWRQLPKDLVVSLPKITKGGTLPIRTRNPRPQTPAIFFAASTNKVGDNLTRAAAQSYPDPTFVFFDPTNDQSSSNSSTSSAWAVSNGGSAGSCSSSWRNHLATVCRATPKVRSKPRKLDRS
jgi:hypothetical protein